MRTTRPRRGIERKILTSILKVGILPLSIAVIVGFVTAREGQSSAVRQTLLTSAQKTTAGLRIASDSHLRSLRAIGDDPDIINALTLDAGGKPQILNTPDRNAALKKIVPYEESPIDALRSIWCLYGPDGTLVASTEPPPDPSETLGGPVGLGQFTQADFVDVYQVPNPRRYLAQTVVPVASPDGQPIGFVSEFFDITPMLKFALGFDPYRQSEPAKHDAYQVLFAKQGVLMASGLDAESHPESPALRVGSVDSRLADILQNPASPPSDSFRLKDFQYSHDARAVDVFLAYDKLFDGTSMYIVVFRPTSLVFMNVRLGAAVAVFFCVIVIAVLCYSAYRNVHNNIVRPVLLLNEGAQIIGQGDLELKLKIGSGDEIEELAQSFNKMALALKHNIRQLAESEEKYRSLVTSMRDGIFQTDPDGTISFLNAAGAKILGYDSVEHALSHNLKSMFLETDDMLRFNHELETKGFVERSRVWMRRRDGRPIGVELSGNLVYDANGDTVGIEGIFRDVTKSVRLAREVRERAERLSAINQIANVINSSLEAGRLYESLVVEVKKLVDFDYAEVSLLSEEGDAFVTRRLWPDREEHSERFCRLTDERPNVACWVARQRECLIIDDLKSSELPFEDEFPKETRSCICVPLYASGRIIGTLNLGANHLEAFSQHDEEVLAQMAPHIAVAIRNARLLDNLQHSLEEVTRAREKLHAANEELKTLDEMKTHLLSNVSHELRTPLVAVMGYTDMILNGKTGAINDVQREYLNISLRNIDKLVTLIENLLDFSRLHRGQEEIAYDTLDLVDCVRTSFQIVQPVADSRQIRLEIDAPAEPVLVEGDKGKLGQVFNNLLSNAVKFNRNGGSVTVTIRMGGTSVDVAVSDTGIGIPQEALDKVFTRFYQYDSSSTRKYGGTGIGLAIAQDIVRLHGSRIVVTSETGQGSTFRFTLPRAAHEERELVPPPQEAVAVPETHLLIEVVTQDRGLTNEIRGFLLPDGMDVIHAVNLETAQTLADKYHPDCMLIDADVPENGRELLDRLLSAPSCQNLPIVLLTSDDALYDDYQDAIASRVRRGFRKSALLSGIQNALGAETGPAAAMGDKVLCVDDDTEILSFVDRCLAAEGVEVDCCTSAEEALQFLASQDYGLVLLDIAMPGMDGWEACRRIKSDPALSGIQVHLVTAKPIENEGARIRQVGADGYLMKPFRPELLVELVREAGPFREPREA